LGDAFAAKSDFATAIDHYTAALKVDPDNASIRLQRSKAYAAAGQLDAAAADGELVLKSTPTSAAAQFSLATICQAQHRYPEALQHYRQTLKLSPDYVVALNNAAWILATHTNAAFRDPAEALRLAQRACELTHYQIPVFIGTLAAALAEHGDFAAAVKTAEQARDQARAAGEQVLVDRNVQLIDLYRAGKPCRVPNP